MTPYGECVTPPLPRLIISRKNTPNVFASGRRATAREAWIRWHCWCGRSTYVGELRRDKCGWLRETPFIEMEIPRLVGLGAQKSPPTPLPQMQRLCRPVQTEAIGDLILTALSRQHCSQRHQCRIESHHSCIYNNGVQRKWVSPHFLHFLPQFSPDLSPETIALPGYTKYVSSCE
jgi:hypothetical protein